VSTPTKLPDILRIRSDGTLFCSDGRDVNTYLADWAKRVSADETTSINIMRTVDQQAERNDAALLRNWGA